MLAVNTSVEQLKHATETIMHPFPHCVLPLSTDWFIEMHTRKSCLLSLAVLLLLFLFVFFFFFFFFVLFFVFYLIDLPIQNFRMSK